MKYTLQLSRVVHNVKPPELSRAYTQRWGVYNIVFTRIFWNYMLVRHRVFYSLQSFVKRRKNIARQSVLLVSECLIPIKLFSNPLIVQYNIPMRLNNFKLYDVAIFMHYGNLCTVKYQQLSTFEDFDNFKEKTPCVNRLNVIRLEKQIHKLSLLLSLFKFD